MKTQLLAPAGADQVEEMLQGLIAECGAMLREQVRPAFNDFEYADQRAAITLAAATLVNSATAAAEGVARLRGQAVPERRQRIVVERIIRLSTTDGEGG